MTYADLQKYIEEQDSRTARDTHSIMLTQGQADVLIADATEQDVKCCMDCTCVKELKAYVKIGKVIVFTEGDYWFDFKFQQGLDEAL